MALFGFRHIPLGGEQDTRLRLMNLVNNIKNNVLRAVEMPLERAANLTLRHGTDVVTRALARMHPSNPPYAWGIQRSAALPRTVRCAAAE